MTPEEIVRPIDPRDAWGHARRAEIFYYAQRLGVTEIKDGINGIPPKDLMVKILKSKGFPPPNVPRRPIGAQASHRSGDTDLTRYPTAQRQNASPSGDVIMDATDVLARDWLQQQAQVQQPRPAPETPIDKMNITELRKACAARGIKMERRDNMVSLKAKLNGNQNAA